MGWAKGYGTGMTPTGAPGTIGLGKGPRETNWPLKPPEGIITGVPTVDPIIPGMGCPTASPKVGFSVKLAGGFDGEWPCTPWPVMGPWHGCAVSPFTLVIS